MADLRVPFGDATAGKQVGGYVAPGCEAVRQAFAVNLHTGADLGAAFAVFHRGEFIADLWGGHADEARSQPLQRNALFNLWSSTKGLSATCIAMLVDRGLLHYESPVAQYWPEFAANGKGAVTVGQLMSHQAGVCGPRQTVTIEDYYTHDRVASLLASQEPFFDPGSTWGYHALALGSLADELVRRVDGRTMGAFFTAEVAHPLVLDCFLGLPESEDHRQVRVFPPNGANNPTGDIPNQSAYRAAIENPMLDPGWPNTRSWRTAGLAGGGGSATARALAHLYGLLANGGELADTRLLSATTVAEAARERIAGADQVSGVYRRYAAGFQLNVNGRMGPYEGSFGHDGWGGIMGFADPERRLGVGYVSNTMWIGEPTSPDPRVSRLLSATYAALDNA